MSETSMRIFLCYFISIFFFFENVEGCTAFQIKAGDGSWIYGRSMEFGFPLDSKLLIVPRATTYTGTAPREKPGFKWKAKYGFVGMNQTFAPTLVSDGMNEKGVVAALLYLPGFAHYEPFDPQKQEQTLGIWELPTLLLSTCATLHDVKELLPTLVIAQQPVPDFHHFVIPLHLYVADNFGNVMVVEFVKGVRHVYDNPLGVLTNSPPFDWHLNHLADYVNLSPYNAPQLDLSNWKIKNYGQGSGLLGLPGDYTSSSRFIRAVFFSHWADTPATGVEGVKTAFHILNTFDIFAGIIKEPAKEKPSTVHLDTTQWIIVHDRTDLKTYFRTYDSLHIQRIDLKKIDFSKEKMRQIPLPKEFVFEDVTK